MRRRLIEKILILLVSIFSILMINVSANNENLKVEGEKFIRSKSDKIMIESDERASSGKYLLIKDYKTDIQYKINVPEAGGYNMIVACAPYNISSLSTCEIRINDGEYKDISAYDPLEVETIIPGLITKFKLQNVIALTEGVNSIYFRVKDGRANDGRIWWLFDCMSFEKGSWTSTGMETDVLNNIFEEKDKVSAVITFSSTDSEPHTVKYRVCDYFGEEYANKEEIVKDMDKMPIIFDKTPQIGYYTVYVSVDGNPEKEYYFSVVKNENERNKNTNDQFAIDACFGYFCPPSQLDGMMRSLKLAGVDYTRERWSWNAVNPEKGKYNFSAYSDMLKAYKDNNIKVMPLNATLPMYLKEEGRLPFDLLSTYDYSKTSAEYFGEDASYEFWNEPDIDNYSAKTEPADKLAAYLKAMSIGVIDSGIIKEKIFPGIAYPPGEYVDLLLQNEVMDYLDTYSFHGHTNWNMNDITYKEVPASFSQNIAYAKKYELDGKRWYLTEAGISTVMEGGNRNIPFKNQKTQARYAVTSMVESASYGVDRHYWFLWMNYIEGDKQWGCFTTDYVPFAVYNSISTLTDVMAGAEYHGKLNIEDAYGYVFERGDQQILCLWSEEEKNVRVNASTSTARLVNIMGNEQTINSKDGFFDILSTPDPQYIIIDGKFTDEIDVIEKRKHDPIITELSKAQRVVLYQRYPNETNIQSKITGYELNPAGLTEVQVVCTNFNDSVMRGTISGVTFGGWMLEESSKEVEIQPFSTAVVTFNVIGSDKIIPEYITPIYFVGEFDGEKTSKTITNILSSEEGEKTIAVHLPEFNNPNLWKRNIPAGMELEMEKTERNGIRFSYKFTEQNTWMYPQFVVPDEIDLTNTKGVIVDVWVDKDVDVSPALFRLFALENNEAEYFTPNARQLTAGLNRLIYPWHEFSIHTVADDNFHLDTDQIAELRVGMNMRTGNEVSYEVLDIGFYEMPGGESFPVAHIISPSKIAEAGTVELIAEIEENEIGVNAPSIRVTVDGTEVKYQYAEGVLKSFVELKDGIHTFEIIFFDNNGKAYTAKKEIMVGDIPESNSITIIFNGEKMELDQSPIIINDRVLLPMRAIFEAMGAEVEWDGDEQKAICQDSTGKTMTIQLNNNTAYIDDEECILDASPIIQNDRILAPLRFAVEAFGGIVEWLDSTKTVNIVFNHAE